MTIFQAQRGIQEGTHSCPVIFRAKKINHCCNCTLTLQRCMWSKYKKRLVSYMETHKGCRLTNFFHSLARSEGSQSSWQILSLSSCRAMQLGLVATARSAMLSFFSRTARWEAFRRSAESLPGRSSSPPNTVALTSS